MIIPGMRKATNFEFFVIAQLSCTTFNLHRPYPHKMPPLRVLNHTGWCYLANTLKHRPTVNKRTAKFSTCGIAIVSMLHGFARVQTTSSATRRQMAIRESYTQRTAVAKKATKCCTLSYTQCRLFTHEHWCRPFSNTKCRRIGLHSVSL